VYSFGAFYWFTSLSDLLAFILATCLYYPVFFNAQLTTIYEYLEKRFDNKTRLFGSFLFILYANIILPLIIYSPSLALSTGIPHFPHNKSIKITLSQLQGQEFP
jgi:sodium-coupled monocarboxylate transporter 8/12